MLHSTTAFSRLIVTTPTLAPSSCLLTKPRLILENYNKLARQVDNPQLTFPIDLVSLTKWFVYTALSD